MTLREHLEAIRDGSAQHPYRYEPPLEFLIEIENHAVAALTILDAAETWKRPADPDYTGIAWRDPAGSLRLVPDPEPFA